ncbi:response regulator [Desulfococcaceae bacterium HSG8]|nr:response regulator [Desulfococcaceae bacterium HSG8]
MIQSDTEQSDILIADDTPENLHILMQILTEQGYQVRPVLNGELAFQVAQKSLPDLILLDILMPGTDGYEVCRRLKAGERTRDIPIIFISALDETGDKVRAFELGGVDYITKPFQEEEVLARVRTHLSLRKMQMQLQTQNQRLQQEIHERKQTELALRESEEKLGTIMNAAADAIILLDDQGKVIYSNPASEKIFGYNVEELKGKEMHSLLIPAELHESYRKLSEEFQRTGQIPPSGNTTELKAVRKNGTVFPVEVSVSALKMNDKWHVAGIVRDITGKKRMQEEVIRARKLESLGILAGGIAHDFNNLLSAILGYINLAEMDMEPDSRGPGFLKKAEAASLKAKDLTSQLITFSMGGTPVKKAGSLVDIVRETTKVVLSGSDVKCEFSIQPDLRRVEFDEVQIRQALRNLIINASESMPGCGSLVVIAENTEIGSGTGLPLLEGNYVKIIIRDQGVGISEENLTRIFDPYFSTGDRGTQKGMGLGLTITWSVIRKHEGHITVESEAGSGTVFTIYLPSYEKETEEKKEQEHEKKPGEEPAAHRGKILVMDDEEMIRDIASHMLDMIGYDTELACDGAEAIELYKRAADSEKPFDAVILDLTIKKGIGGVETVRSLTKTDPHVRAIVSSGYSNDPVITDFRKYAFAGALAKPYTIEDLTDALSLVFSV